MPILALLCIGLVLFSRLFHELICSQRLSVAIVNCGVDKQPIAITDTAAAAAAAAGDGDTSRLLSLQPSRRRIDLSHCNIPLYSPVSSDGSSPKILGEGNAPKPLWNSKLSIPIRLGCFYVFHYATNMVYEDEY